MADFDQSVELSIEISSRELRSAREQIEDAFSDIPIGVDAGAASSASRRGRDGSSGGDGGGDGAASVAAQTELMRRQLKHQKRSADLDEETGAWLEQIQENTATLSEQFGVESGGQGGGRRRRRKWERQRTEDIASILAVLQNADLDEGGGGLLGGLGGGGGGGGGFLSGLGLGGGLAGGGLLARLLGGARGAAGAAGSRSPFALLSLTAGMRDVSGRQPGDNPLDPITSFFSGISGGDDGGVDWLQEEQEIQVTADWPDKPWWVQQDTARADIDAGDTAGFDDLGPGPSGTRGLIDREDTPGWMEVGPGPGTSGEFRREDFQPGRGGELRAPQNEVQVDNSTRVDVSAERDEQEIVDEVMSEVEAENRKLRSELERALGANI